MIDFQVAYDKLSSLETCDDIANLLRSYNVKAIKGDARACAITIWMEGQIGRPVSTNYHTVRVVEVIGGGGYRDIFPIDEGNVTPAMEDFMNKFDTGYYPDMEV